ncbi:MAG: hypothetical protein ACFFCQ_06345 [Promethearchaeota archaeon]
MILIEFFLNSIASSISLIAFLLVFKHSRSSPILEMHLLRISFLFSSIFLFSMLPSTVLYSVDSTDPIGIQVYRIGIIFGQLAILGWSFTFLLPSYKTSYRAIFLIFLISASNVASLIINYFTLEHNLSGDTFRDIYSPLGIILIFISVTLFSTSIGKRLTDVGRIVKKKSPFTSQKALLTFLILGTLSFGILYFTWAFPSSKIPTMAWCIPLSLTLLFFAYAFSKDESFFFITPTKMDAVLITDQETGMTLFSQNFQESMPAEELLGGLFSALNISLKETIQSKKVLEEISFGDKVVILAPGKQVTAIIIVSEKNLIIEAVAKHLIKEFETRFQTELVKLQETNRLDRIEFKEFSTAIAAIRLYFPL